MKSALPGLLILAWTLLLAFGGKLADIWADAVDRIAIRWGYDPENF